jgi:hypothetical protein
MSDFFREEGRRMWVIGLCGAQEACVRMKFAADAKLMIAVTGVQAGPGALAGGRKFCWHCEATVADRFAPFIVASLRAGTSIRCVLMMTGLDRASTSCSPRMHYQPVRCIVCNAPAGMLHVRLRSMTSSGEQHRMPSQTCSTTGGTWWRLLVWHGSMHYDTSGVAASNS